jgi:membrane protein implicated in regulation of membrane protease activity
MRGSYTTDTGSGIGCFGLIAIPVVIAAVLHLPAFILIGLAIVLLIAWVILFIIVRALTALLDWQSRRRYRRQQLLLEQRRATGRRRRA